MEFLQPVGELLTELPSHAWTAWTALPDWAQGGLLVLVPLCMLFSALKPVFWAGRTTVRAASRLVPPAAWVGRQGLSAASWGLSKLAAGARFVHRPLKKYAKLPRGKNLEQMLQEAAAEGARQALAGRPVARPSTNDNSPTTPSYSAPEVAAAAAPEPKRWDYKSLSDHIRNKRPS